MNEGVLILQPGHDLIQPGAVTFQRWKQPLVFNGMVAREHPAGGAAEVAELAHVGDHLHGRDGGKQGFHAAVAGKHLHHRVVDAGHLAQMHGMKLRQAMAMAALLVCDAFDFRGVRTGVIVGESDAHDVNLNGNPEKQKPGSALPGFVNFN